MINLTGIAAVIAAWFSLILIIELIIVTSSMIEPAATINGEISSDVSSRFETRIVTVQNKSVVVEIANLGPYDKRVSALYASDMFITYVSQGVVVDEWLGYGLDEEGHGWVITAVLTGGYEGELRDPIILPEGDEGVWNVGETLVARLTLAGSPNSSYPILIKLVVP